MQAPDPDAALQGHWWKKQPSLSHKATKTQNPRKQANLCARCASVWGGCFLAHLPQFETSDLMITVDELVKTVFSRKDAKNAKKRLQNFNMLFLWPLWSLCEIRLLTGPSRLVAKKIRRSSPLHSGLSLVCSEEGVSSPVKRFWVPVRG